MQKLQLGMDAGSEQLQLHSGINHYCHWYYNEVYSCWRGKPINKMMWKVHQQNDSICDVA